MALAFRSNTILVQGTVSAACNIGAPGAIVDDDILIFMLDRAVVTGAITRPSGFAELDLTTYSGARSIYAAWKRASSESGSYNFTWTGDTRSVGIMYAISGAITSGDPTTIGTIATGSDDSPDPPSTDPGSSDDRLAIAYYGAELKAGSVTQPSGYTEPSNSDGSTSGSGGPAAHSLLGVSYLLYTGQAQDPGVATLSASGDWATNTIVLDPPAGGSPHNVPTILTW